MKLLSPITKALFILVVMLLVALVILWNRTVKLQSNNVRLQDNYAILQKHSSEAQELTKKEFKIYYSKLDSIAKSIDIKTKNIKQVIVTEYHYKDSTIIHAKTVVDTVKGRINFEAIEPKGCYSISGYVSKDSSVYINNLEIKDKLSTFVFIYKDIWFWKLKKFWQKPKSDVKVYSECLQDTLKIVNNIQIIKK